MQISARLAVKECVLIQETPSLRSFDIHATTKSFRQNTVLGKQSVRIFVRYFLCLSNSNSHEFSNLL